MDPTQEKIVDEDTSKEGLAKLVTQHIDKLVNDLSMEAVAEGRLPVDKFVAVQNGEAISPEEIPEIGAMLAAPPKLGSPAFGKGKGNEYPDSSGKPLLGSPAIAPKEKAMGLDEIMLKLGSKLGLDPYNPNREADEIVDRALVDAMTVEQKNRELLQKSVQEKKSQVQKELQMKKDAQERKAQLEKQITMLKKQKKQIEAMKMLQMEKQENDSGIIEEQQEGQMVLAREAKEQQATMEKEFKIMTMDDLLAKLGSRGPGTLKSTSTSTDTELHQQRRHASHHQKSSTSDIYGLEHHDISEYDERMIRTMKHFNFVPHEIIEAEAHTFDDAFVHRKEIIRKIGQSLSRSKVQSSSSHKD